MAVFAKPGLLTYAEALPGLFLAVQLLQEDGRGLQRHHFFRVSSCSEALCKARDVAWKKSIRAAKKEEKGMPLCVMRLSGCDARGSTRALECEAVPLQIADARNSPPPALDGA